MPWSLILRSLIKASLLKPLLPTLVKPIFEKTLRILPNAHAESYTTADDATAFDASHDTSHSQASRLR